MFVLSIGWSVRAVTLAQTLRTSAFVKRNDWASAEEREDQVPQPYTTPRWTRAWVDPY